MGEGAQSALNTRVRMEGRFGGPFLWQLLKRGRRGKE